MNRYQQPTDYARIISLDMEERCRYLIEQTVANEVVWGLRDGGWAMVGSGDNRAIPLWPGASYAEACAEGAWSAYQPEALPRAMLLERLLPRLEADGVGVALFPTVFEGGGVMPARMLQELLGQAIAVARRSKLDLY
jgi:hypothetical protein